MRTIGAWIIGIALGVQLVITAFWTATSVFELYEADWYNSLSDLVQVANLLTAAMLLVGFVLLAVGFKENARNGLRYPNQGQPGVAPFWSPSPPVASEPQNAQKRLEQLQVLKAQGHLSTEEHDQQRARVLETL